MPAYKKRDIGYFKWSAVPASKRGTQVSEEQVTEILNKLMTRPHHGAIVSSTIAERLRVRGCKINKRQETVLENGVAKKVIEVWATWIPAE